VQIDKASIYFLPVVMMARGWPVFLWIALGCSAQRTPVPEQITPPPRAAPQAGVSPSASAEPVSTPSAVEKPEPVRPACDASSCNYKTETCCESVTERQMTGCVNKALAPPDKYHRCYGPLAKDAIGIECLTSADCPSGQSCCGYPVDESAVNHCAAKCDVAVACTPDQPGSCRAGFRCKPSSRSRSGGICVVKAPRTACGNQTCSGATPVCCYDMKTKSGKCIPPSPEGVPELDPACPLSGDTAILQCTTPADCGGEDCCAGGPFAVTSCGGERCMSGIQTCGKISDCPEFLGPPTGCRADPDLAFLKICRYQGN
jgi:hypothetical protein